VEISNDLERGLEIFYRDYIDVFNTAEVERFLTYFANPYVSISGDRGTRVVANDAKHASDFARIMQALKARGWVRSDIVGIKAWALDEKLGMIVSDVVRVKADGSILEEIRACYIVRREDAGWKIATISEIKPPHLGPGDLPRPIRN
jgi:hypothetical protein